MLKVRRAASRVTSLRRRPFVTGPGWAPAPPRQARGGGGNPAVLLSVTFNFLTKCGVCGCDALTYYSTTKVNVSRCPNWNSSPATSIFHDQFIAARRLGAYGDIWSSPKQSKRPWDRGRFSPGGADRCESPPSHTRGPALFHFLDLNFVLAPPPHPHLAENSPESSCTWGPTRSVACKLCCEGLSPRLF